MRGIIICDWGDSEVCYCYYYNMAPFWWFPHQIVVGEASWFR